jgi:hypothetical protein
MASKHRAILCVFPSHGQAEKAIDSLRHLGIPEENLRLAAPGEPLKQDDSPTAKLEKRAETGAVAGAATGGVVGAVAGAAVASLVPAIGPVIGAGVLGGILGGAAAGAAAGAYVGPFVNLRLSKEDARHYESEYRAGRTLVAVDTGNLPDASHDLEDQARQILLRQGAERLQVLADGPVDPSQK